MTAAIVVLAYNRPAALKRLLDSIAAAFYPEGIEVPLVISIDRAEGSSGQATLEVASSFVWEHGDKRIITHSDHLGVIGHFKAAGELTREYGSVILLEDDLTVAPPFYEFASAALAAFGDDWQIGGCCLYGLWFNGFTHEPFLPVHDGGDAFFLQLPYTQGLCFSAMQWASFESWWATGEVVDRPGLHPAFLRFGKDEWFPALASYLVTTERYFCFPRFSMTIGWGDAGTHFSSSTSWFQTPVQVGSRPFYLLPLHDALAVYDGFYEMLPDRARRLASNLAALDFDLDLNASKKRRGVTSELVLTTRPVKKAMLRFRLEAYPPEMNLTMPAPNGEIALARVDDVRWDGWAKSEADRRLHTYHQRHHRPSRRRSLRFGIARLLNLARNVGRQNTPH